MFSQVLPRITVNARQTDHTHPAGIIQYITTYLIYALITLCIYIYIHILCTRMLCVRAVEQVTATYACVSFNIIIISYCSVVQTFIQGPYYTIVYTATQFRIYYVKVRVHYARIPILL